MQQQKVIQANLATFAEDAEGYGLIEKGALVIENDKLLWVGEATQLPSQYANWPHEHYDGWITPALVDCHTHIVYAGNRSNEFEARLNGKTYAEIAAAGGGIMATVQATRAASEETLLQTALPRVKALLAEGLGTLEIKSGYGLTLEDERKMLRVARRIGQTLGLSVVTTFLGAHARPPEFENNDVYIDAVLSWLPQLHAEGLVDAVDAFCEHLAFSRAQCARVFQAARDLGLPVKLHAEQLSDQDGAALVAEFSGLSADHIEYLSTRGVEKMRDANVVAVLLPGAFYTLRETQLPPIAALREAGVPMAISTDANPGTSPLTSLLLTANMACTLFGLTPQEALSGVTKNAAKALGLGQKKGQLAVGFDADLALWAIARPADLCYQLGFNPLQKRMYAGQWYEKTTV